MNKTEKKYRKYTIAFENRDLVLLELDYEKINDVPDEVDLLIDNDIGQILVKKPINNAYTINVRKYEDLLFSIKKQLEVRSRTDVLKLILDRDQKAIDFILFSCNQIELFNIMAALAVFNDSYFHRTNKLTLVINEELFEQFKATSVHYFFKVFVGEEVDDRMYKFKQYFYFARRVFLEIEKHIPEQKEEQQ